MVYVCDEVGGAISRRLCVCPLSDFIRAGVFVLSKSPRLFVIRLVSSEPTTGAHNALGACRRLPTETGFYPLILFHLTQFPIKIQV